ncbi:MAG: hypothetical protein V3T05_07790 [Myxococcota bacterium]
MTTYLEGGWYQPSARSRLRSEVIDGAMDIAGLLLRGSVPVRRVLRTAIKVRSLVVIADPLMRGTSRFGPSERGLIVQKLSPYTDDYPELQGFVGDCVDQVSSAPDMTAFYLHLVHIARMMQLLDHATKGGLEGIAGLGIRKTAAPTRRPAKAKKGKRKAKAEKKTKNRPAKKRPAKKKAKKRPAKKKAKKKR